LASQLNFYEFFCGGGFARIGLGEKWRCLFANEWATSKVSAYREAFDNPTELSFSDVRDLTLQELPGRADLAWASFPCQDLSLAGSRKGMSGERSGTFHAFWELMQGLRRQNRAPRSIVIENVTGLLSSSNGSDFKALLDLIAGEGYEVGALTIDAADFLPQSRPRLFVVALEPTAAAAAPQNPFPCAPFTSATLSRSVCGLEALNTASWKWWYLPKPPIRNINLINVLEPDEAISKWHSTEQTSRLVQLMDARSSDKLKSLTVSQDRKVATVFRRMRPDGAGGKVQRAEIRDDGLAGCLRTPAGGSSRQIVLIAEAGRVRSRLLTPREASNGPWWVALWPHC